MEKTRMIIGRGYVYLLNGRLELFKREPLTGIVGTIGPHTAPINFRAPVKANTIYNVILEEVHED